MNPHRALSIILISTTLGSFGLPALAQDSEVKRLSGFAEHQSNLKKFQKAREQGEREYLEQEEQWENKKQRELEAYKKQSKARSMADDGPEAREDAAQKKKIEIQYEKSKAEYAQLRQKRKEFDRQALHLPTEMQELGIDQNRPRYDYKKRASFGATPKFGKNASSHSGSSGSYGGGGGRGGGGSSFPPPPTFDDFQDNGYLPAPTLNDDFMGDIPPPPPPPPPFGGDIGVQGEGGMDFPPPPPPPTFGDDPGDF